MTVAQPAGDDCSKEFFSSQASNSAAASTQTANAGACLGKNLVHARESESAVRHGAPLKEMEERIDCVPREIILEL